MQSETTHLFDKPKRRTIFGLRASALLEIVIALAVLLLLDVVVFDHTRYWSVNPHPFWFVVLFIACKYGTAEAVVAALASSFILLFGNVPEQTIGQDSYAWILHILRLPLLWLISAVAFGELRQMHIRERNRLENALQNSEEREHSVAESYQWVKTLKDQLELRMAGQLRSAVSVYHAARMMEALSTTDVLKGLEEIVGATLYPEQFSIYMLENKGLESTLMHGWKDGDKYQRNFASSTLLYQTVVAKQEILCVVNKEHERLLNGEGILAGPLLDRETGEVVGMLKIEKMGFSDLNLSNIEAFGTICEWAGMAIVNANKYQNAKDGSIINPDHNLFTSSYFKRYTDYLKSLAERVGFDVSIVAIKLSNRDTFDEDTRLRIGRALSESVESVLRKIDLAFDHQEHSEEYTIVLPTTNRQGAQVVVEKLRSALAKTVTKVSKNANFAFTVQMIYEKRAS
jgi:hypothetical protein